MTSSPRRRPWLPVLLAFALALPVMAFAPAGVGGGGSTNLAWTNEGTPGGGWVQGVGGSTAVLVASVVNEGTYRSFDDGRTWEEIPSFPDVVEARVGFDPSNPLRGYVAGFGGLARTTDGGQTWELILDSPLVSRVHVTPTGRVGVAWRDADSFMHLLVSDDGGDTWTNLDAPLGRFTSVYGITSTGSDDAWVAMTIGRTYATTDGGATWDTQTRGGLALAAEDDGTVWRAGFGAPERSDDGGFTWQEVAAPGNPQSLASRPGGGLFAGTHDGFLVTKDHGATWTNMGFGEANFGVTEMFADPEDGDAVMFGNEFLGVGRVGPAGDGSGTYTFSSRTSGLPPVALDAVAASADGSLMVAAGEHGIFASRSHGQSWDHTGAGMGFLGLGAARVSADGSHVYVGGQNRIFQPLLLASSDGGRTFTVGLPMAGGDGKVVDLAVHPDDPSRAFAALAMEIAASAVWETRDGGASWTPLFEMPLVQYDIQGVAWHAPTDELLVATGLGVMAFQPAPVDGVPSIVPRSAGGSPDWVASAGGVAYSEGAGLDVWATLPDQSLFAPWGDTDLVGDRVAVDPEAGDTLWLATNTGQLHACGAPTPLEAGCKDLTPPSGTVQDVHLVEDGRIVLAASLQGGVWRAEY